MAKALNFNITKKEVKPSHSKFVKEIFEAKSEIKDGKDIKISLEQIVKLLK
jgi:hypothetical protein